jgi:HPt (histidine-containing phosphotransfer) domain-containing protein
MPGRRQLMLAAALLVSAPLACVTGGGSSGGSGLVLSGGLVVFSVVASDAHAGKKGAAALWCRTLQRVDSSLAAPGRRDETPEAFAEPLLSEVNAYAREAGYSLHLLQLREVITDARRVSLHPEAGPLERQRCRP